MTAQLRSARPVPPGRIVRRELEARGWTQNVLAEIMGRPPQAISEIINARKAITPETACQLAAAFGTSAEVWLNLESNYRLHQARQNPGEEEIARRGRLFSLAPVTEMVKRGWIEGSDSLEELERQVCEFLGIDSTHHPPQLAMSCRHTATREPETAALYAWVRRVSQLAAGQVLPDFRIDQAKATLPDLLALSEREEDIVQVPTLLCNLGIHFVVVPHLAQTYLDGAALTEDGHPIVALTLRHDRIDSFWFTILHELAHILSEHPGNYLDDLDANTEMLEELEANQMARDWLINPKALEAFANSTVPYFSEKKVMAFAKQTRRHPGIVVGRLQFEELIPYRNLRKLQVKVRPYLASWIEAPGSLR